MPAEPLIARPREDFVATEQVQELTERALGYLEAGLGVNFEGASGTGKTTLALHVATQRGRPMVLMTGDNEFGSSNLLGSNNGFRRRKVVDNFIHSVLKVDEESVSSWVDERLTVACKNGYTLVYDEFTRSKAEANNVLLPVLEEGLLIFPNAAGKGGYMKVHPDFRAVFTSNPDDYAGVHLAQEALRDRLVTMRLEGFDLETEAGIVASRSELDAETAHAITTLVRETRSRHGEAFRVKHSVRAALQIAKVVAARGLTARAGNLEFERVVVDILTGGILEDARRAQVAVAATQMLRQLLPDAREPVAASIALPKSGAMGEGVRLVRPTQDRAAAKQPSALGNTAF
jgi:nitric oxide reductase NorQ protein